MGAPAPTFIPAPFASGAGSGYVNFPIPDSPPSDPANGASWTDGFPPITMQSEQAGGLPPLGQDVNGILLTLSGHTYAQQAGQPYLFDATFSGTISGYAVGAQLGMADGSGNWLNTSAGNETDPDTDASAAGWVPGLSYGITYVTGLTGGTVTLAPSQTRRNVIELSGVLVSNLTIVLPATLQQWLIVNNTTGAFTTTVTTASGAGVTVPQGGPSSPMGVWGDGTNIYPSTAPLSVPISQDPTALTLAERTNAGYLFATYFNQSSALENPAIGSVIVQNTAEDGYFRKISLANFGAQLFASPALTGTPTAPTAAAGTSSTQIATTAFVNPGQNLSANGYQKLPSGLILQWGSISSNGGAVAVTFPVKFSSACFGVQLTTAGNGGYGCAAQSVSAAGFTAATSFISSGVTVYWFSVGV